MLMKLALTRITVSYEFSSFAIYTTFQLTTYNAPSEQFLVLHLYRNLHTLKKYENVIFGYIKKQLHAVTINAGPGVA